MEESKKKKTLTISTSFDKKKLGESNFRRGEKKVFIPEKKRFPRNTTKSGNFLNQTTHKLNSNKKNFARNGLQQAKKIHSAKKNEKTSKNLTKLFLQEESIN